MCKKTPPDKQTKYWFFHQNRTYFYFFIPRICFFPSSMILSDTDGTEKRMAYSRCFSKILKIARFQLKIYFFINCTKMSGNNYPKLAAFYRLRYSLIIIISFYLHFNLQKWFTLIRTFCRFILLWEFFFCLSTKSILLVEQCIVECYWINRATILNEQNFC